VLGMTSCLAASSVAKLSPELLDKARVQGSVLVIVTLRAPAGSPAETLEAVKQAVLAEIASTRYRVIRALPTLPQLVLEASEDTLRVLAASPNVLRIDESVRRPPLR
jgi:hypothetical protein